MKERGLCVAVCAAGPAGQVGKLVQLARAEGWAVNLIATPSAVSFLDSARLEELVGSPVRSEHRAANGPRTLSIVDAVIVAPATYNTINKLALGISDNYMLGTVAESIGRGTRVVIVPFVNAALATRRAYGQAVESLRGEGVTVVAGPQYGWEPHEAGAGDQQAAQFPWARALSEASLPGGQ